MLTSANIMADPFQQNSIVLERKVICYQLEFGK